VRVASPGVEVALLDEQRRVRLDHVAFGLVVAVGEAQFVVRAFEELLAHSQFERRVVEIASGGEFGGVEGSQQVRDFVFEHVAAVGEVRTAEVGHEFQTVARAEDVGVGEPDHRPPFGVQGAVGRNGPTVACRDEEIDARGVQRVGQHGYVHVGDVAARAQQLFVPHDELRIESVARAEEQVAPDHPVARQVVEFVARAFQPVAAVVEHLPPFDGDVADRLACVGGQQQALVGDAAVRGGVQHGPHEKHLVEQVRHAAAFGFRTDAVVETGVARGGPGIGDAGAVGREAVRRVGAYRVRDGPFRRAHAGTRDAGERGGRRCREQQENYAEPDVHRFKDNAFFVKNV